MVYHYVMPFDLTISRHFSASHHLRLYDGSVEKHHRHEWEVILTVGAERLDSIGIVIDFHKLERMLDAVLVDFQNRRLNDHPAFAVQNPSAENVAVFISQTLKLPEGVMLRSVEVRETPTNSAIYRP